MRRRALPPTQIIWLAAFLVAGQTPVFAETQNVGARPPLVQRAQIDRNGVLILVRSVMSMLDNANKSGNYTVMRDLSAPAFAAANDPSRLAEIFANIRRSKIDLSGTLVLEPQLTQLPEFDKSGNMHIAGFFPSAPMQVNFQLIFAPVSGQWRLLGITTDVGTSVPVAPDPPLRGENAGGGK